MHHTQKDMGNKCSNFDEAALYHYNPVLLIFGDIGLI